MCSAGSAWALPQAGCPIRIPPDHRSLPTPRRFSQVAASFFGVWCLGIHLRPLVACPACIPSPVGDPPHEAGFVGSPDRVAQAMRNPNHHLGNRQGISNSTYSVDNVLVEMTGLEPVTPCVQSFIRPRSTPRNPGFRGRPLERPEEWERQELTLGYRALCLG